MLGMFMRKYLKDNMSEVSKMDAPTIVPNNTGFPFNNPEGGPIESRKFGNDLINASYEASQVFTNNNNEGR